MKGDQLEILLNVYHIKVVSSQGFQNREIVCDPIRVTLAEMSKGNQDF